MIFGKFGEAGGGKLLSNLAFLFDLHNDIPEPHQAIIGNALLLLAVAVKERRQLQDVLDDPIKCLAEAFEVVAGLALLLDPVEVDTSRADQVKGARLADIDFLPKSIGEHATGRLTVGKTYAMWLQSPDGEAFANVAKMLPKMTKLTLGIT